MEFDRRTSDGHDLILLSVAKVLVEDEHLWRFQRRQALGFRVGPIFGSSLWWKPVLRKAYRGLCGFGIYRVLKVVVEIEVEKLEGPEKVIKLLGIRTAQVDDGRTLLFSHA